MEAVAEITDPATLVEMIVSDPEWFVRHEALSALRDLSPDQEHYARVMRESGDEEIRRKVVKVLTDERELQRAARHDPYRYVRDAATHRIEELRSGIWNPSGS